MKNVAAPILVEEERTAWFAGQRMAAIAAAGICILFSAYICIDGMTWS